MPIDQSVIRDRALRRTRKGVDVHVGALMRTLTARCARGRCCPRASDRVCVRMKRLTRRLSGLRASWKQGRGLCMPGRGSWGSRLVGEWWARAVQRTETLAKAREHDRLCAQSDRTHEVPPRGADRAVE